MALGYAKSCLIGAIMESIAYGLYFTIFLQCLQALRRMYRKRIDERISVYLLATTLILFVLITMRMVLDNKAAVEAFTNDTITPNAAEIYFTSFGNGAMFRTGTYIALTIVADIFIVYRVFAVWNRSFIAAAVPFLLAVADIVSGALFIKTIRELVAGASPDGDSIATHALVFYGFTLGLNVICTCLISLKIYLVQRQVAEVITPSMNLSMTMVIVVESAALYSACLIAVIVPTALGSNVQYCILSLLPGIVGIAFSLIIVRVGSGLSPDATTYTGPGSNLRFGGIGKDRSHFDTTEFDRSEDPTEQGGIQVHFKEGTHSHTIVHSDVEREGSNEK